MDTHTSSRRAVELTLEQEVAEEPRNERDRAQRAAGTSEQRSEKAKGDQYRARQTASEKQATSQWKSTRERGAETPEKEKRGTAVQRYGTLNEATRFNGITFNFYTGLPHIYFSIRHSYLSFHCPRETGFNNT